MAEGLFRSTDKSKVQYNVLSRSGGTIPACMIDNSCIGHIKFIVTPVSRLITDFRAVKHSELKEKVEEAAVNLREIELYSLLPTRWIKSLLMPVMNMPAGITRAKKKPDATGPSSSAPIFIEPFVSDSEDEVDVVEEKVVAEVDLGDASAETCRFFFDSGLPQYIAPSAKSGYSDIFLVMKLNDEKLDAYFDAIGMTRVDHTLRFKLYMDKMRNCGVIPQCTSQGIGNWLAPDSLFIEQPSCYSGGCFVSPSGNFFRYPFYAGSMPTRVLDVVAVPVQPVQKKKKEKMPAYILVKPSTLLVNDLARMVKGVYSGSSWRKARRAAWLRISLAVWLAHCPLSRFVFSVLSAQVVEACHERSPEPGHPKRPRYPCLHDQEGQGVHREDRQDAEDVVSANGCTCHELACSSSSLQADMTFCR